MSHLSSSEEKYNKYNSFQNTAFMKTFKLFNLDMEEEKVSIYILQLTDGKYYVGRSKKNTIKGIQNRINI